MSIVNLVGIRSQIEKFYNGPYIVKGSVDTIDSNFEAMQKSVFRALSTRDMDITNEAIENVNKAASNIQEHIAIVEKNFLGDKQLVVQLKDALSELAPMREHVLELASQNSNDEAADYMESNNIIVIKRAQEQLDAIVDFIDANGDNMIANLRAAQLRAIVVLVILGIASVVVSVLFGIYITRSITRPLQEVEAAAQKMAQGYLTVSIDYESRDELGSLASNMRTMTDRIKFYMEEITSATQQLASGDLNVQKRETFLGDFKPVQEAIRTLVSSLNDTLSLINESADQVSSGADQVSSGAQALSQGATEQASSVEELAATINEMSVKIQQNAGSARRARETVDEVGAKLLESNQQMQEMTKAMDEISASSGEIGKIIKTIEDIAFQTNILALNAAVEAARAGAAGKGFAVVADEVRNLASKSSDASKSTSALIEGSLKAVENGTRIADETAKSLMTVVEGTKEITAQINQIADASEEQAQGAAQVTTGIDQISSVVQTNSATAQESAAASEELSGQAMMFKDLVSRFKLKESKA